MAELSAKYNTPSSSSLSVSTTLRDGDSDLSLLLGDLGMLPDFEKKEKEKEKEKQREEGASASSPVAAVAPAVLQSDALLAQLMGSGK